MIPDTVGDTETELTIAPIFTKIVTDYVIIVFNLIYHFTFTSDIIQF